MANFTTSMDFQQASTQAQVYSGALNSLCTIQQPSGNIVNGAPEDTFTDVLTNIPCMNAVRSEGSIDANEKKAVEQIESGEYWHTFLNANYPTLFGAAGKGWRAIVDGVTYDLLGTESDSQGTQTRLNLQIVTL
jgi:hypothetical protein